MLRLPHSLLLLLGLLVAACHRPPTVPTPQPLPPVQNPTPTVYQDPLFFIEGQLCQHLREIFQDSKGQLWLGTNVYDLMRYDGDSLVYLTEKDGFSGGRVTGIVEDSAGALWIATGFGLNRYDGTAFQVFTEADGLASAEIWSLHLDSKGIFWIGHNEGLSRFDGVQFENIAIPKPSVKAPNTIYSPNRITAVVEDAQGQLWLGTDGYGICHYDGTTFTHLTTADGLCDNTIYDLLLDRQGRLWIGTFWGGIASYDGHHFTNYTKDSLVQGVEVTGLFEDDNGDIWFGVENHGVYQYDGTTFKHYYEEVGLRGSTLSIHRDQAHRFWFGGWGGLFRYDGTRFSSVTRTGPWE